MHAAIGLQRIAREARALERRAAQSDKRESLATLARGTAAELGDLVSAIQIRAELMRAAPFADLSGLDAIGGATAAAARLLAKLRRFAVSAVSAAPRLEPLDLAGTIREAEGALRGLIAPTVRLELHLAEGGPAVDGDPGQLRELVLELVLNAAEAIGDGAGAIHLTTRSLCVEDAASVPLEPASALRSNRVVCLEVRDSGCGMDERTLERIFDPFFSTRGAGRGLGLAAALGIAHGHGGGIAASSGPGAGSVFTVYLPASARAPAVAGGGSRRALRSATVLVVDDDQAVRELTGELLGSRGHAAVLAESGGRALEVLRARGGEIDLVVLDWAMPEPAGRELLCALRGLRPEIPVVIASGCDPARIARELGTDRPFSYLGKPFDPDQLEAAVQEALGHRDPEDLGRASGDGPWKDHCLSRSAKKGAREASAAARLDPPVAVAPTGVDRDRGRFGPLSL